MRGTGSRRAGRGRRRAVLRAGEHAWGAYNLGRLEVLRPFSLVAQASAPARARPRPPARARPSAPHRGATSLLVSQANWPCLKNGTHAGGGDDGVAATDERPFNKRLFMARDLSGGLLLRVKQHMGRAPRATPEEGEFVLVVAQPASWRRRYLL